jgi:hypothetical protein
MAHVKTADKGAAFAQRLSDSNDDVGLNFGGNLTLAMLVRNR